MAVFEQVEWMVKSNADSLMVHSSTDLRLILVMVKHRVIYLTTDRGGHPFDLGLEDNSPETC